MSETETKIVPNHDGTEITIIREQDVEPILKENARLRSLSQTGDFIKHKSEILNPIAEIPNSLVEKWLLETPPTDVYKAGIDPDHTKRLYQKLRSPDYRYLRTSNTRI